MLHPAVPETGPVAASAPTLSSPKAPGAGSGPPAAPSPENGGAAPDAPTGARDTGAISEEGAASPSREPSAPAEDPRTTPLSLLPIPMKGGSYPPVVIQERNDAAGEPPLGGRPSDPVSIHPAEIADPPIIPESPKGSLLWRVRGAIRTLRPHQWVKNLFVLAPVVFAKHLTHPSIIKSALGAFGVFCLLAGAVYTLNDLVDVKADRVHPVKRHRPIASGRVPVPVAKILLGVLIVVALGGAMLGPPEFFAVTVAYFGLNIAYSFWLKKIAYLDVACIATGFVLRVLAGGFATRTPISGFMVACTALLALFLGFGKRRHELASANASKQRAALEAYSPRALTVALAVTGVTTVATYLAYTLDHDTQRFFENPYLWVTTVHPLFGVLRFLQLVATRPKAESPTQEILRDTPFMMNLVLWVIEVIAIVYRLRPS
jgi:4-hydroxybenzoate polyprenyltransferase